MKIKVLKLTNISSGPIKPGEEIIVDDALGSRLCKNKIAEIIEPEQEQEEIEEASMDSLTVKELFNLCKEKEIELDKTMINGKSADEKKEYMISKLQDK